LESTDHCPHCLHPGPPGGLTAGQIIECSHCDHSYIVPGDGPVPDNGGSSSDAVPSTPEPMSAAAADAPSELHGATSDVPLVRSGVIAAGVTLVFYVALVMPLSGTYFGALFGARGWVPYTISYLAFWSGVLLVEKYRELGRQTRVLELDLLPRAIAESVTPTTAASFLDFLQGLPAEYGRNFLVQRVGHALQHFRARSVVSETVDVLRNQAERDENVVESSYTMLRVFIWAIPILGFIGTVLGIGASVGGFSESVSEAANLEVMKDSIGVVTSGLGVAFDTTLLALVMSIFIMFPASSLQKAEEEYLDRVSQYCHRHLISRLDDGNVGASGQAGDTAVIQRTAERLADELLAALERRGPKVH
jgi:biopolymer transport protein ExbB/TolQ